MTTATTFGVVLPESNTVTPGDFAALAPEGMRFDYTRFHVDVPERGVAGGFLQLLGNTRKAIRDAVLAAIGNGPDALVMATSAETFWGGVAGNAEFEERIGELTQLDVTTGASACDAALIELDLHRIALLTPYQPTAEREARVFFEEAGYDVVRVHDLRCADAAAIAAVTEPELRAALHEIDNDDIEAIVQVGTNLPLAQHLATFEAELGKPVLAINAVTLWHAARSHGLAAQLAPSCSLFTRH